METLPFDMADFPSAKAMAFVQRGSLPGWIRVACFLGWAGILAALVIATSSIPRGSPNGVIALGVYALGYGLLVLTGRYGQRLIYRSFAETPYRMGPRTIVMHETGLTLTAPTGTILYPWAHVLDVIEGPGGVLALLGPFEYQPIPTSAFADHAAMQAFITTAKAHLAAQNEPQP
jgi:hypothetical protein